MHLLWHNQLQFPSHQQQLNRLNYRYQSFLNRSFSRQYHLNQLTLQSDHLYPTLEFLNNRLLIKLTMRDLTDSNTLVMQRFLLALKNYADFLIKVLGQWFLSN